MDDKNTILKRFLETPIRDNALIEEARYFLNDYYGLKEHPFSKEEMDTLSNHSLSLKMDMMLWKFVNPKTQEEKRLFYRNTPFEFIKNLYKNMDGMHLDIFNKFLRKIKEVKAHKILDYSGGSGFLAIQLYRKGFDITFSEINKLSIEWMRHLAKSEDIDIKIIDLFEEEIKETYDMIIVKDVLEHLDEPFVFLNKISKFTRTTLVYPEECMGEEDWLPMHKEYSIIKAYDSKYIKNI